MTKQFLALYTTPICTNKNTKIFKNVPEHRCMAGKKKKALEVFLNIFKYWLMVHAFAMSKEHYNLIIGKDIDNVFFINKIYILP